MLQLVVGTRPEVVQAFPLATAAAALGITLRVVVVGQHTDPVMSRDVLPSHLTAQWNTVALPVSPFSLGAAIEAMRPVLADGAASSPPLGDTARHVIVIGDTDTAIAAALAASEERLPVAHVEAGLRSHDWQMKEERNRTLIDHLADVLFPPTALAEERLAAEHVHGAVLRSGDVHVDAFRLLREGGLLDPDPSFAGTYVCTIHRRENILDAGRLAQVCALLGTASRPLRLLLHPHTRQRIEAAGLLTTLERSGVAVEPPLPFLPFVRALAAAAGVVTDSGGVQKQAFLLGVPCVTLRPSTEWVETLADGWNRLLDPAPSPANPAVALPDLRAPTAVRAEPFGDGHAAERILRALSI